MVQIMELPSFKDSRGSLTVIEKNLPFSIRRVYYIHDTNELPRGGHAHRVGQQALICLHGECAVHVKTENDHQTFLLNIPQQCLLLEPNEWHSITFEPGSILLVLASIYYSANNYTYD